MKKLTLLFTLLVTVFTCVTVRAQGSKDQMIADWQRAKEYTKKYWTQCRKMTMPLNQLLK